MIDAPGPGGKTWEALLAAGFDARQTRARPAVTAELAPLPTAGDPQATYLDRDDLFLTVERLFEHFKRQRGCGGYHFAGGASVAGIGRIVRDISRHNAVDKLVGFALLERAEPTPVMVALSGRISADIVFKAWRAGITVLVTRSLPTAEAVALAEYAGVTVVGRALGQQRAIFSHVWRFGAVTAM
jgi:FdhD protein